MKLFLPLLGIGYLFASCSSAPSIKYLNDLEQANIKGQVTKLVTETFGTDSSGQPGNLESVTTELFNDSGYTIADTTTNMADGSKVVNVLHYNQNGSLSTLVTFENGKKQSSMILKYDGDSCTRMNLYDANDKSAGHYDVIAQTNRGLLARVNSYDSKGALDMSYVNEYDSIYQTRATAKDGAGTVTSDVVIHLTDRKYPGEIIDVSYFKDSSVRNHLIYKYDKWDSAGNWIQQTIFDEKNKPKQVVKRIFVYRN